VLTVTPKQVRLRGVTNHRSRRLRLVDLTTVGAVPVTSVARTLLDCLPWLPGPRFEHAVDDARRRGVLAYESLADSLAHLDAGRATGRHLVVPARQPVARRPGDRSAGGSRRELDLGALIETSGLPRPVPQHELAVGGRPRHLDWAYPTLRIAIEFDGFAEHGLVRSTFDDDRIRTAELLLAGWLVLQFTSAHTAQHIVSTVRRALELRTAA
jgi:hypothetical protein